MTKEEILKKISKFEIHSDMYNYVLSKLDDMDLNEFESINGIFPEGFYTILIMRLTSLLSISSCFKLYRDYIDLRFTEGDREYPETILYIIKKISHNNKNDLVKNTAIYKLLSEKKFICNDNINLLD